MGIIKKFRIEEISLVKSPAQPEAKAVILKSSDRGDKDMSQNEAKFFERVKELKKKHPHASFEERAEMARAEFPDVHKDADRFTPSAKLEQVAEPVRVEEPETAKAFGKHVAAIKSRDGCTHTQAIQRARVEHPAAFEAMQSA